MSGFLFTWNPDRFDWERVAVAHKVAESRKGKPTTWDWSCSNSRKPQAGDRAFMMKVGKQGRGIFAAGTIVRGSRPAPPGSDYGPRYVLASWDSFLDPDDSTARLDPFGIPGQHWTPEGSGVQIAARALATLEARWAAHLAARRLKVAPLSDADTKALGDDFELEGLEGEVRLRVVAHRSRERKLRTAKLAEHRGKHASLRCEVCAFDFDKVYGVEYAEVHHLRPLAKAPGTQVTKLSDLAVLCANCHRVAHLDRARPLSLRRLRALLA